MASRPLHIAFVWHMHQPYYRDTVSGACAMPWVRLHATKDYLDMVTRLEAFPNIHHTFNLVPSLLDQLEEYLPPANRSDEFLDHARKPAADLSEAEQRFILKWFFLANIERMIKPYPRYHDLLAKRGVHVSEQEWPKIQRRFRTQDYLDLQVWFNLVWIDPWIRSQDQELARLEAKGGHFTEEEKGYVLKQHLELIGRVLPTYRAAATRGQIEITTSPYYHPILPLLCDTRAAHDALPHLPLPSRTFRHPEDARWHLRQAIARHQAAFGQPPQGLWPSEGSVSEEAIQLAIEAGLQWLATDEDILWRSLKTTRSPSVLHRPYVLRRNNDHISIIFRDRELSDLLGFVYSHWEPSLAVKDFLGRLGRIHEQLKTEADPALVSVILDGENAWESYANDGHDFLTQLYHALANDPRFRCVTVTEFLQQHPPAATDALPSLFSGSWIDGNFATWIGHPEKNLAWEYLADAREALASISPQDPAGAKAWQSLGIAEGSDWMWWFGDTHYTAQADEFDRLFRTHLANAYTLAGLPPSAALSSPIRRRQAPSIYEPTSSMTPTIDGKETSYYEWLYAGQVDLTQQYAAMHRGDQCLRRLLYGFDDRHQYLRIDLDIAALKAHGSWSLELQLAKTHRVVVAPHDTGARALLASATPPAALSCGLKRLLELAVPNQALGLKPGQRLEVVVSLKVADDVVERYPAEGAFHLIASAADLDTTVWLV